MTETESAPKPSLIAVTSLVKFPAVLDQKCLYCSGKDAHMSSLLESSNDLSDGVIHGSDHSQVSLPVTIWHVCIHLFIPGRQGIIFLAEF